MKVYFIFSLKKTRYLNKIINSYSEITFDVVFRKLQKVRIQLKEMKENV